jgi:hypothetical protein
MLSIGVFKIDIIMAMIIQIIKIDDNVVMVAK